MVCFCLLKRKHCCESRKIRSSFVISINKFDPNKIEIINENGLFWKKWKKTIVVDQFDFVLQL